MYTWDTAKMEEVRKFKAHEDKYRGVNSLAVHPNKTHVLSSSFGDNLIKLWDWESDWKCIGTFKSNQLRLLNLRFNPWDDDAFATGGVSVSDRRSQVEVPFNLLLFPLYICI